MRLRRVRIGDNGMTLETAAIMQAWASIGGVLATLLVGGAQFFLILAGLRQMRRSSESRDRQVDAQSETLAALVRGLETVIERTAPGKGQA